MRIAFDAKRAFQNHAGLGNYSRNLIRSLSTYFQSNDYLLFTPSLKTMEGFYNPGNSRVITPGGAYKILKSYWRSYAQTGKIKKEKVEIYHGLSNEVPYNINKAAKSVVTIHDLIFIRYPELYKRVDWVIYNKKFSYACGKADKIVAISKQTKEDIKSFYNIPEEKISVVYQSCNPLYFNKVDDRVKLMTREKYHLPPEYVLCVGTIETRKNQLNIIKAMSLAGIKIPLVLVGKKTSYFNDIQDYIRKNRVQNVIFPDRVETADLPAIYQDASLFVYPSVFEGFGIPIIEALFSGVPVVSSNTGCFPEAGGPSSLYANPEDPDDLAEKMKLVFFDREKQEKMRKEGKAYAEKHFSEHNAAQNMINVYKDILAQ